MWLIQLIKSVILNPLIDYLIIINGLSHKWTYIFKLIIFLNMKQRFIYYPTYHHSFYITTWTIRVWTNPFVLMKELFQLEILVGAFFELWVVQNSYQHAKLVIFLFRKIFNLRELIILYLLLVKVNNDSKKNSCNHNQNAVRYIRSVIYYLNCTCI